jgi:predicted secreted protein
MAKEHGSKCLLQVSDGGVGTLSGSVYGIGSATTLTRSSGDFTSGSPKVEVGDMVEVSGFANAANRFFAQVKTVVALTVTFANPIDVNGLDVTPVVEAAGPAVTIKIHKFSKIGGEKNTRFQGSASDIDTSDKTTGGWGSSITGTRKASVQSSGIINWPDTAGLKFVRDAWAAGNRIWARVVMNEAGDFWVSQWSIGTFEEGGGDDSATEFSLSLANSIRAKMCYAA